MGHSLSPCHLSPSKLGRSHFYGAFGRFFQVNPGVGAITAMSFFTPVGAFRPTHLLAGCSDGTVTVWSVVDGWQCMKTLKGHRDEVFSVAVHSTGVLALSTSRDGTLRLWDLVKGRTTFHSKLEESAEEVIWSPSGRLYALRSGKFVRVFRVGDGDGAEGTSCVALEHSRRVSSMFFGIADDAMITGTEDGKIRAWHLPAGNTTSAPSIVVELDGAHANRVKAFAIPKTYTVVKGAKDGDSDDEDGEGLPQPESTVLGLQNFPAFLASASSDGHVSVWNLRAAIHASVSGESPIQDASTFCLSTSNTKARLTTLCSLDSVDMMEVKALELSMKNKQTKKQKQKKIGGKAMTRKVTEAHRQPERPERPQQGPKTTVHGKDTVVSFFDEKDAERQAKRAKKIEIESKRRAQTGGGQKKRRR